MRRLTIVVTALYLCTFKAMAAQHSHDTLFSRDNAIMAAAAVETVNVYCVGTGSMTLEYTEHNSKIVRETIEGLSEDVLNEPYVFNEEDPLYLQGVALGEQLIQEAEQKDHVSQMCTQPEEQKR
ncbi:hypothetical protein C9980_11135 [Vibrio mediterranei]|uniref:Uncharacterized protein n=1 Tax=Vibrio mediterranei TaxID=689 RepID=A0A3G4VGU8_9VIBR|nr:MULTISPECIES: hypothetical protein [Vibrio]AYV23993.1 hypothetical protein ECB94_22230 [Vibrio mediterranei]NUW74232.1 hypothetical protein [Vibrio mediterranei]PTC04844.1 hypothetical protein C9980_11135 [Vibrio mediterranei]USE02869.1 hypothetical protein JKJ11_24850 [Vibrio sp. SCSIO 43133]